LAALVIVIAGLKVAAPMIAQFLLALFIAVSCMPSIHWMEGKKVPRGIAVLTVLCIILFLMYLIVSLVGDSISSFNANKDIYTEQLVSQLQPIIDDLGKMGVPTENIEVKGLFEQADIMSLVTLVLGGVGVIFSNFFVIFLSVIFILAEATSFPSKLARAFSDTQEKMIHGNHVLNQIRHYLAIKAGFSLLTGVLISILLLFIGVDYPFLWGMLAFLLNFIPTIGSLIAAIPAIILALVQFGPVGVFWTALSFFAVNNLVGNYLEPKFMGKMLGLSAFVVFLSLIFWGFIFGSVGMFLSVPLTMTIKIVLDTNDKTRWIGILLGSEDDDKPAPINDTSLTE
jgi:AI-2 transport protein TqsA